VTDLDAESGWTCAPDQERVLDAIRGCTQQLKLLTSDPYRAGAFDPDRPITDQMAQVVARLHRTCPTCGEVEESFDRFQIEYVGHGIGPDHPRVYSAYGKRLTYTEPSTSADEQEVLAALEGWCVDALIEASRRSRARTGRYPAAAELRGLVPTPSEVWRAKGGSRSRLSTWVNRHMRMRDGIRRVQPSAAERAIAALREEGELTA
jgi:hypothetical protein